MARHPDDIPDSTLRLHMAPGLGPATIRRLQDHFGSDDAAAGADTATLAHVEGIGSTAAAAIRRALDHADPAAERRAMTRAAAHLLLLGDPDYPALLASMDDPPPALWLRGELADDDRLGVAIVGSRRCTGYGREQAARFASLLAQCGITIVSGGALGIDAAAHRGARRAGGRTIAVMGCGLANCYPPDHAELFAEIVASRSALLSAHPMHVPPRPGHFPRRNRIIAGTCVGVVVVEAAQRSGALITARVASQEGREVMAVPGRVDSAASAGCHRAIREGWAALVSDHVQVLEQLDAASQLVRGAFERAGHPDARRGGSLLEGRLDDTQRTILDALRDEAGPLGIDAIAARTGLDVGRLMAALTLLQVRGCVRREQDGTVTTRR